MNCILIRIKYTIIQKLMIYNNRLDIPMLANISAIPWVEVSITSSVALVIVLIPIITPFERVWKTSSPILARKLTVDDTARVSPIIILPLPLSLKCDNISKFSWCLDKILNSVVLWGSG